MIRMAIVRYPYRLIFFLFVINLGFAQKKVVIIPDKNFHTALVKYAGISNVLFQQAVKVSDISKVKTNRGHKSACESTSTLEKVVLKF